MSMDDEETTEEPEFFEAQGLRIRIPECCKEGSDYCPHGVGKQQKRKTNIGL